MPRHDLHNSIKATKALKAQNITSDTTTVGTIIDLRGYESCDFQVNYGTLADSDMVPLIEHGDASNLSDAAAVDDADLLGTEAVKAVGYRGGKRYVRLSIVSTSTTSNNYVSATAVLGGPSNQRVEPDGATPG